MIKKLYRQLMLWGIYILPHHILARTVGLLVRLKVKPIKNFFINNFINIYKVNMQEAKRKTANEYENFGDFFTRHLEQNARPIEINANNILSPADGFISELGKISDNKIIQAKQKDFSVQSLLGNINEANNFIGGDFITVYLSPKDYHRTHMPIAGKLIKTVYIPGRLFSVNPHSVGYVDNLFARNERLVSIFQTELGLMAYVLVGAFYVASINTVWAGQVTPGSKRELTEKNYNDISLQQGDEMGHFNLGSTAIVLFEKDKINFLSDLKADSELRMGQIIATKK